MGDNSLFDWMKYCETTNMEVEDLFGCIMDYFNLRIEERIFLTEEEITQMPFYVKMLKNKFSNAKERLLNQNLITIRNLVLLSIDNFTQSNYYQRLMEIENSKLWYCNGRAFSERISILLDNTLYCTSRKIIESQVKLYFHNESSIRAKYNVACFLESFTYDDWDKTEQTEMAIIIWSLKYHQCIVTALQQIYNKLQETTIDFVVLEEYFSLIENVSEQIFKDDALQIIEKILALVTKDNCWEEKLNDRFLYEQLCRRTENIYQHILKNLDLDCKLRKKIKSGELAAQAAFSANFKLSKKVRFENLKVATEKRIIAIDDKIVKDRDGAFSIQQFGDVIVLNVYIVDAPCFLKRYSKLCSFAYEMGNTLYLRAGKKQYAINMIPRLYSINHLSLSEKHPNNTIAFRFVFNKNGELYSRSISRKRIQLSHAITPAQFSKMIHTNDYYGAVQDDLKLYQGLCKKIIQQSQDLFLCTLNPNSTNSFIAVPSLLINYYLGYKADFAIYREGGKYSKSFLKNPYTRSATPLRSFVSDINLAFFLTQKGIVNFSDKELGYVERNIDEIIDHLNEREQLQKYIDNHSNFARKYLKRKK